MLDEHRTPAPAAVDNAIAAALTQQYGFLPLHVRYDAARRAREHVEQWISLCGDLSVTGGCGRPKGHTEGHTPYRILDDPGAVPIEVLMHWVARQNTPVDNLLVAELRFLAARYAADGSGVNFRPARCTGISSDALAWYGVSMRGEPQEHEYPADESDLSACERTYEMAPPHVQARMLPVLQRYRNAPGLSSGRDTQVPL